MLVPISVHDGTGAAGLIDEVADQVIGDLAEVFGGQHRIGELFEGIGVDGLDGADEGVEADGIGHASTVG